MVSPTFKTHSTSTITSTKISRPSIGTKQGKASFDRARKLTTPGMDSFREKLHAERISDESADLIPCDRRLGSDSHYESV